MSDENIEKINNWFSHLKHGIVLIFVNQIIMQIMIFFAIYLIVTRE